MRPLCSSVTPADLAHKATFGAACLTNAPYSYRNRDDAERVGPPGSVQGVSETTTQPYGESPRLRGLVGLVGLEALAMAVLAAVLLVELVAGRRSTEVGFVVAEVALAAVVAAVLALVARGLARGQRWVHGLGLTLQIFGLPFGVRLWQFGHWWAAVPMLAVLVAALVLFFALAPDRGDDDRGDIDRGDDDRGLEQPAQPDSE
jgi:hypothetical protein